MATVTILEMHCKGCGLCVEVCKQGVLRMSDRANARDVHAATVNVGVECLLCGRCYLVCPDAAIVLEDEDDEIDAPRGHRPVRERA